MKFHFKKWVGLQWRFVFGVIALVLLVSLLVILGTAWAGGQQNRQSQGELAGYTRDVSVSPNTDSGNKQAIEQLAETERNQGFSPGMGLAESSLYEQSGDLAGAVFAAFKEVFFAYQYGYLKASDVEERLNAVGEKFPEHQAVSSSLAACRALLLRNETQALEALSFINLESYEFDSFPRWIERVLVLDTGKGGQRVWEEFLAIRSRYRNYPLYWILIARRTQGSQRLDAAERSVSLAPQGPFAAEGRSIMAMEVGLTKRDAPALRTKLEIEQLITGAAQEGKGEIVQDLFPLLALPDNPYTLYALGACRGLASQVIFANFFEKEEKKAAGRLAERFRYILGGRS